MGFEPRPDSNPIQISYMSKSGGIKKIDIIKILSPIIIFVALVHIVT